MSDSSTSRQPNSDNGLGAAMRFFKTVPFPIPKYVGTVSHPDGPWAACKPGMILRWACTVAFMSISDLSQENFQKNINRILNGNLKIPMKRNHQ